LSLNTVKS